MRVFFAAKGGLEPRRGFTRTLVFGLLAALGVPALRLLGAPVLGFPLALSLYLLGLAVAYLAWIAGSRRRALGAALLAAVGASALGVLAPGPLGSAVGAALLVSVVRSGVLYRAPQPRLLLTECVLLLLGLFTARLLAGPGLLGIALAVWGYFLVQSGFFLLARPRARSSEPEGDPFERARERLESLLDELEATRA